MSNKTRTGWVYVLTNESIAGQVKVGFTSGRPEDRAKELNTTGVPTPYKVASAFLFSDKAMLIEQRAHRLLDDCRVSPDREFFRCSGMDAVDAIRRASEQLNRTPAEISPVLPTPKEVVNRGDEIIEREMRRQLEMEKKRLLEDQRRKEEEEQRRHRQEAEADKEATCDFESKQGDIHAKKQEWVKAVECYRWAAEQGHAQSQLNLGNCYRHGNGVPTNLDDAIKWYRKAAEQGDAEAQFMLAKTLASYVRNMKYGNNEEIAWYMKAANQGHLDALYELGRRLDMHGSGYPKVVVDTYKEAAKKGHSEAQYKLGELYAKGKGVEQSYHEAVKWYRMSADNGSSLAQARLGECYLHGNGVSKNFSKAKELIEQAIKSTKGSWAFFEGEYKIGQALTPAALLKEVQNERVNFFQDSMRRCDSYQFLRRVPKTEEIGYVINSLDEDHPHWDQTQYANHYLINKLHLSFKRLRKRNSPPPPLPQ
jgi:TPR repeat protein